MKFVTRERPKVDRVACPWLIRRFIDPGAELLFVPADDVMAVAVREGAFPFDVPDVELGHHNGASSFEAFIEKYNLHDPALLELAKIVRAADTQDRGAAPEGEGLRQIANGWHLLDWPLDKRLEFGFDLYDCLYAACKQRVPPTVLFLCPHSAAKSVLASAYFQKLADQLDLRYHAAFAGTEPDEAISPAVAARLKLEGFALEGRTPRRVTGYELAQAAHVISLGCDLTAFGEVQYQTWDDIPAPSRDLEGARQAIFTHVEQLITELKG